MLIDVDIVKPGGSEAQVFGRLGGDKVVVACHECIVAKPGNTIRARP